MRVCHSGFPSLESSAMKLPLPSPANNRPPAVASSPAPTPPPADGFSPGDAAGFVVDGGQEVAGGTDYRHGFTAEPHGTARIGIREVQQVETIVFRHVEQSRLRRIRRRRPVRHAAFDRRHQRSGNRGFLEWIRIDDAVWPRALGPVGGRSVFGGDDVFAGHAIQRVEVAVALRRRNEFALPAIDDAVDQDRSLRGVPVVRVMRLKSGSTRPSCPCRR